MSVETELKLLLAPVNAGRVMQHPLIERCAAGPQRTMDLLTLYYDTPDFALHAAGIALRLRRIEGGWVQSIKWGGDASGGLHRRQELEVALREQRLDLDALDDPGIAVTLAPASLRKRLAPVFTTEVRRTVRLLAWPEDGSIEVCVDRGRIVAGYARAAICELELELERGNAAMLFDLVAQLEPDMPLRPAVRSKAERGYLLAGVAAPPPARAKPVVLDRAWSVAESATRIVASGLDQMQSNEAGVARDDDPEYLHQMRVAVRRLRSCLGACADALDSESFAALRKELRWLGRRLGPARDWDVFLTELLPALQSSLDGPQDAAALRSGAKRLRDAAARSARSALKSRRYARLVLSLGRIAASGEWSGGGVGAHAPVLPFATRILERRLARVLAKGDGIKAKSLEDLHAMRIAVKKLRYAVEFFAGIFPGGARGFRDGLVKLQDCLGTINDAGTVACYVDQAMAPDLRAGDRARDWSARRIESERLRLRTLWRGFRGRRRFW